MSRDKKNKTTKNRHKWLEILRWVLIVVLLVVGLALFFNKSIRNTVIAWNTNKYQVSNVSKKTIEKNKEAKTSFDFENVQSVLDPFCKRKWMLKSFRLLVVLPFLRSVSISLFQRSWKYRVDLRCRNHEGNSSHGWGKQLCPG